MAEEGGVGRDLALDVERVYTSIANDADSDWATGAAKDMVVAYLRRSAELGLSPEQLVKNVLVWTVEGGPGYIKCPLKVVSANHVLVPPGSNPKGISAYMKPKTRHLKFPVAKPKDKKLEPNEIDMMAEEDEDDVHDHVEDTDEDEEADEEDGEDDEADEDYNPSGKKSIKREAKDQAGEKIAADATAEEKGETQEEESSDAKKAEEPSDSKEVIEKNKKKKTEVAKTSSKDIVATVKLPINVKVVLEPSGEVKQLSGPTGIVFSESVDVTISDIHRAFMAEDNVADIYGRMSPSHKQKMSNLLATMEYTLSRENLVRMSQKLNAFSALGQAMQTPLAERRARGEPKKLANVITAASQIVRTKSQETIQDTVYYYQAADLAEFYVEAQRAIETKSAYGTAIIKFLDDNPKLFKSDLVRYESKLRDYIIRTARGLAGDDTSERFTSASSVIRAEIETGKNLVLLSDAFGGNVLCLLLPDGLREFFRTQSQQVVTLYSETLLELYPNLGEFGLALQKNLVVPYFSRVSDRKKEPVTARLWGYIEQGKVPPAELTWHDLGSPDNSATAAGAAEDMDTT